ncbi:MULTISPECIES: peptidase U32 family protein [Plesiomonas]|uniref:peptidase U32 family protein n=1 Tax=Plesiomonas TaxID=702 RepID=UPI001C498F35|nr:MULTISPECIES: U32 family peptidase [Plesiomonas]MCE5163495.1 U32 family peptidase [Plesiomonas sp. PI-19]MCQ8857121.1 U32 family peptidase [Plesiomonas shigelloides]
MMVRDNRLELLAPAKNLAFGIEAIKHGADAVYIGGPAFGARAAAGNSVADIEQLAAFAHRYGAQVFVALNTILKDSELAQAEVLAHQIWNAGADALIVQDLGLLQCDLPPIALHASTQLDNRTPEKVRFLQDVGFSQVVLARELSLEQIRAVSEQTSVQLEFFIHGALCVAYSGQCYISHALTGRSANRGECAQICRVPCSLKTREGETLVQDQHLLSLKDMNQTANLRAMIDAGIRSFKIEGRLKDLSYIKNVTAWYRQHLDEILEERPELSRSSAGRSQYSFVPNPDKTFNRGSTDYFLLGRQPTITSFRTPKYIGEEVGKVTRVGPNWFEVSGETEFNNGDGLCYFNARQVVNGLRVNRADGRRLFTAEPVRGLTVNTVLYRNRDQVFDGTLEKESATRQIGVTQHFSETTDGFLLQMTDEQGFSVSIPLVAEKSPANNPERAFQSIREQLAKLGNTLFYSQHIDVTLEQAWFIPVSALNALRRQAVEALEAARINGYPRPLRHQAVGNPAFPQENLSYLGNVYNQAAENFYRMHGVDDIAPAYELNQEADEVSLMITKHCLRYTQNMCPKEVKGLKPDPLVLEMGNDIFRLKFDCKRCEMHVLGKLKSKVQRSAS